MADDDHAVANAGLVLTAIVAERLGIEALADELVDLGDRPGGSRSGRKILSLAQAIVADGDCIGDVEMLRAGATEVVLGHKAMAASTCGTFLRSFTFGHIRQLDQLSAEILGRAWAAGAGPGDAPMTMDLDSTVCEVHGDAKQGAAYGYTRVLGLHPLMATRAETGEVLHVRQRKGSANTGRGAERFVNELAGRVRRSGASGLLTLRADSGFHSAKVIAACRRHHIAFSITVNQTSVVRDAIAAIDEDSWVVIDYPEGGRAEVAETAYKGDRLIVRRTRLVGRQARLWPEWRHHAFVTDRVGTAVALDADHRNHAVVELAIRDLKEGAGWNHSPSGKFLANAAWIVIGALAHNLLRWVAALGLDHRGPLVAKTIRRRLITIPGRLTRSARRDQLHIPRRWPWRDQFLSAALRLRNLPLIV
ncbi:MAG TPA: IS1380 family transposase [Acidimicrobiales bacterium]|nr:IS1380 family transposase [Acidimicrobiales bacterium]